MKNLMKNIKIILPAIFRGEANAFFTLKNRNYTAEESEIDGLNLGFNTGEKRKIIEENRRKLFQQLDIDSNQIAFANQIHSNKVRAVSRGGTFKNTDALITQTVGLALAIQVADCAAILISEPESRTIAAVHSGWRGASLGIISKTLEKMKNLGAKLASAKAYISPCICLKHFEVGEEVAEQFPAAFVDYKNYTKPHVNLKAFLKNQLIESGLKNDNIDVDNGCTVEDEEQFYSYRREKEKSGRMLGVIQM